MCPCPGNVPLFLLVLTISSAGPRLVLAAALALQARALAPLFGKFMQIRLLFFLSFFLIPCCCCSAVSQIAEVLRTGVCIGSCGTRVPAGCSAKGSGEGLFQGQGDREQLAEAEDGGMKVL